MKTSIKTIGLPAALAMGFTSPLFSQVPDLTKDTQSVDRKLTYNLGATGLRGWIYTKAANNLDGAHLPMWMDGNVFFQGTKPSKHESAPINRSASDPGLTLVEKNDGFHLTMTIATALGSERPSKLVPSARLGKARISGCAFENSDGSPITIGTDYFGKPRNTANPTPGPFEAPGTGTITMKVWPLASTRETK